MKKILKTCMMMLVLLVAWSMTSEAYASHLAGVDITYEHLAGHIYKVTVTWIRDCDGEDLDGSYNELILHGEGCGWNHDHTLTIDNIETISQTCGTVDCSNPGSITVYERYTCSALVFLPSTPCGNYVFSVDAYARNGAIQTGPGNADIYVEAFLDNTGGDHDSPTFGSIPLTTICAGQPFSYNNLGQSNTGGSLTYQLVSPQEAPSTDVTYNPNYSATDPYDGPISLDPNTGALTGTPPNPLITVLAILVTEKDANGNVISRITRDIQLQILACNNTLPVTIPTPSTPITICAGAPFSFPINSTDADGDLVGMVMLQNIPGASFSVVNQASANPFPTGTFSWTPTNADIGTHSFTIGIGDNACPVNGTNIYTYNITVEDCCDDFEFNVGSCCNVAVSTGADSTGGFSVNRSTYRSALQYLGLPNPTRSLGAGDECDPCVDGSYIVWVEDEHGDLLSDSDPCITIDWLDENGVVLATGSAFQATPDVEYTVRVTNSCLSCTWEEDFFFCCEDADPGFSVSTQCTHDNFIITVTSNSPTSNSQFNLYTAIAPCTSNGCMLDSDNPDQVISGPSATFILPKVSGAMYIIKHGEWTLCEPWTEHRQLVLDPCCPGPGPEITHWCEYQNSANASTTTTRKMERAYLEYNRNNNDSLSASNCDYCSSPQVPFIIFAVDPQGNVLDENLWNVTWTLPDGSVVTGISTPAYVEETYILTATGPDNCIFRDTFEFDCCPAPENLACALGHGGPVLSWDAVPYAIGYQVIITENDPDCCTNPTGGGSSYLFPVSGTSYVPQTTYSCASWQVRALCSIGGPSDYSEKQCLCSLNGGNRFGDMEGAIQAYPSPASELMIVEGASLTAGNEISIVDLSGKVVQTIPVESDGKQAMDVSQMTSGIYFLHIKGDGIPQKTVKIVVQH